jgi:hypothetical protein
MPDDPRHEYVYLGGSELFRFIQAETLRYATRNRSKRRWLNGRGRTFAGGKAALAWLNSLPSRRG